MEVSDSQVAKVELAHVRRTHPFELRLWNIRDPPAEVDEREAKKWRRLYQYDIVRSLTRSSAVTLTCMQPVLHLEDKRIQKHRIDRPALQAALEAWYAQKQEADQAASEEDPKTAQTNPSS